MNVGDLVRSRFDRGKVGIVVEKKMSNEGLTKSMHTQHIISVYPLVYYVCFSGEGKSGPYMESDLVLQQGFRRGLAWTDLL
jgi:hypothetical protein